MSHAGSKNYKWVVWGLPVLAYIVCFFHSLSMGVIHNDLIREFRLSEVTFSYISTAYFYAYLLMQIPGGILVDTVGPRLTVAVGTAVSAIGSAVFGYASGFYGLFIGRLLIGLGVSVIFVAIIKIQSQWFEPKEFGTMSGLTCLIGTMGGVLAQTPLALLIETMSWRGAFRLVVWVSVGVAILVFLFVKDAPAVTEMASEKTHIWESVRGILSNRRTWPPLLLYAGLYGTFVMISGFWGTAYMSDVYHISTVQGAGYIAMIVLGSAFGALAIGWISDRVRRRRLPVIVYCVLYLMLWGALTFINQGKPPIQWMMALFFALGFFSQGFVLSWAIGKEVNNPRHVGMTASIINVGGISGSIVIPSILALFMDGHRSHLSSQMLYHETFIGVFGIALLILLFAMIVKETYMENCFAESSQKVFDSSHLKV